MRDPKRIDELLTKLGEAWHKHPDLRFGQFMSNFFAMCACNTFYTEDDVWLVALQAFMDGQEPDEAIKAYLNSEAFREVGAKAMTAYQKSTQGTLNAAYIDGSSRDMQSPQADLSQPLTDNQRAVFDELFGDEGTACMYLASLVAQTPNLVELDVKLGQIGLLNGYFSDSTHPKRDYYLQKLAEITHTLENDRKALAE